MLCNGLLFIMIVSEPMNKRAHCAVPVWEKIRGPLIAASFTNLRFSKGPSLPKSIFKRIMYFILGDCLTTARDRAAQDRRSVDRSPYRVDHLLAVTSHARGYQFIRDYLFTRALMNQIPICSMGASLEMFKYGNSNLNVMLAFGLEARSTFSNIRIIPLGAGFCRCRPFIAKQLVEVENYAFLIETIMMLPFNLQSYGLQFLTHVTEHTALIPHAERLTITASTNAMLEALDAATTTSPDEPDAPPSILGRRISTGLVGRPTIQIPAEELA
ncbi:hypothetical protein BJ138DRAFT_1183669, partial [Hygrophoropsis aurantiaca]